MSETADTSTAARILYKPVGLASSIIAGIIASVGFKQIWKRVAPHSENGNVPTALQREIPFKEILLGALLQGAIFAGVKVIVQRQGALAFRKATGEWPGKN